MILVHLVKLFASADRGVRMALLDHLSEYSDKLDKKTVSDKIWPNLVRLLLHVRRNGLMMERVCSKLALGTPWLSSVRRQ